ncbi:hypothetical protein P692DRAFT_2037533 [Suillus brevipes Sb2]|jgi:hypothetical protein|nr:hypothetical protein P692DRAFT_2037533 [Suillus brevipes Sb2]
MLTGREANKYHVERNRNLDDVVDRESIIAMTGFNGGIATSPITYSPPFQRGKHIIEEPSGAEYRTVASISTRNIGPLHFIMQIAKTLRSLIQMRYASGPEHIQVSTCRPRRSVLTGSAQSITCKCGGGGKKRPISCIKYWVQPENTMRGAHHVNQN